MYKTPPKEELATSEDASTVWQNMSDEQYNKIRQEIKEKFDKKDGAKALELCRKYNESDAIVTNKKVKKDVMNPPKLYSLTKLQNYLGKKHKMSMERSLEIVQKLYEAGYLTYPRTNSEYLAVAEKGKIKKSVFKIEFIFITSFLYFL